MELWPSLACRYQKEMPNLSIYSMQSWRRIMVWLGMHWLSMIVQQRLCQMMRKWMSTKFTLHELLLFSAFQEHAKFTRFVSGLLPCQLRDPGKPLACSHCCGFWVLFFKVLKSGTKPNGYFSASFGRGVYILSYDCKILLEYTYGLSDRSSDSMPWSCTIGVDEWLNSHFQGLCPFFKSLSAGLHEKTLGIPTFWVEGSQ